MGEEGGPVDILTRSHIGDDGRLRLDISTDLRDVYVAVHVSVVPLAGHSDGEYEDWPAGFIDETYGSLLDDPLVRLPQDVCERREGRGEDEGVERSAVQRALRRNAIASADYH